MERIEICVFLLILVLIVGIVCIFFRKQREVVIKTSIHQEKIEKTNVGSWFEATNISLGSS
jgi:hypothetical protein